MLAATVALLALSLAGFAIIPRAIRPRRAAVAILASVSVGALAIGWGGWLTALIIGPRAVPFIACSAIACALPAARSWASTLRRALRFAVSLLRSNLLASLLLGFTLALLLPQLLLPIVDSDGLHYHLGSPKLYLLSNALTYNRWDIASALPQTAEMLYLVVLRLADGETAKWLHAGFFVLALAALAITLHRQRRSRTAALLAPLLLAVTPVVIAPAGAAFVDAISLFHLLIAAMLLFGGDTLFPAALALGAAMATKVTTAPVIAGLWIYALITRGSSWRTRARTAALLIIPLIIAFAPFGIRNIRETGDPLFPIGYTLLHRPLPGVAADRVEYTTQFHGQLAAPLGIGWFPGANVQPDEVAGLHHLLGLIAVFVAIRDRRARSWLAFLLPCIAVAILLKPPTRYLIPMFAGLAALEAIALTRIVRHRLAATAATLLVASPALFASASFLFTHLAPFDFLLGRVTREQFLATRVPAYRAAMAINRLPPGDVLAFDFPAVYYLDRPWLTEGILNDPPLRDWIAHAREADDVLAELRTRHLRYIAVTPGYGGGTPYALMPLARNRHDAQIIVALRQHLRPLLRVDGVDVFEVH